MSAESTQFFTASQPFSDYEIHRLDQLRAQYLEQPEINPKNWKKLDRVYLPGTGFSIRSQVEKFRRDYQTGQAESKTHSELVSDWLGQTKQDLTSFKIEYLLKGLVIPNPQIFADVDGQKRVVGNLYGNQPVLDTISAAERSGSVRSTFAYIEEELINAPAGTLAFFTSPDGWSGLKTDQGKEIRFPDTQTYIWRIKEDRQLEAVTIVSDMKLGENQKLLQSFGVGRDRLSSGNFLNRVLAKFNPEVSEQLQREEIVKVVQNTVVLRPQESTKYGFETIVDRMRQVRGRDLVFKDQGFEAVYQNLGRLDQLMELDQTCEGIWGEFSDFVQNQVDFSDPDALNQVALELENIMVKISRAVKGKDFENLTQAEIRQEVREIGEVGGCNGGGESSLESETIVVMTESGPKRINKYFRCPIDKGGCGCLIEANKGTTICPRPSCRLDSSKLANKCA